MLKKETTEKLLNLCLISKSEELTGEEKELTRTIIQGLKEEDREQIVDLFLSKYMNLDLTPERFSAEAIKSLNRDKQYFTKSELLDMLRLELTRFYGNIDIKAVFVMVKSLITHKYYHTVAEAESNYPENRQNKGKTNQ